MPFLLNGIMLRKTLKIGTFGHACELSQREITNRLLNFVGGGIFFRMSYITDEI